MLLTRSEPLLAGALADHARARVRVLGESVLACANDASRGLAGAAGDALVHLGFVLASSDARHADAMHAACKRAANGTFDGSAGLFDGLSGLRAVADLACDAEPRYAGLVARCDAAIEDRLPIAGPRVDSFATYDLMQGWAGMRLARAVRGPREADRLSALLGWIVAAPARWQCAHPLSAGRRAEHDLGLAHGIASILAALALGERQLSATTARDMAEAAALLRAAVVIDGDVPMWPATIGSDPLAVHRSAWCYGTPGVVAALFATAQRLGDAELAACALDAAERCARRSAAEWQIDELGICHGLAGNALAFAALAVHGESEPLRRATLRIIGDLLDALDVNGGVSMTHEGGETYAATDELKGLGGIALTLMTLCGDIPSTWMRLHGLPAV